MGLIKPDTYVHPNKREKQDVPEKATAGQTVKDPKVAVKKKKVEERTDKPNRSEPKIEVESTTVLLRLVARVPANGQIKLFDDMIDEGLSPKEIILGIWKREFGNIETLISDHDFKSTTPLEFENRKAIETTRKVTSELLISIQSKIDPFNILTERALGQKLGEAILIHSGKER